jgi:hypothetical protein
MNVAAISCGHKGCGDKAADECVRGYMVNL